MSLWGREERLRIDREKTEKLLNKRALMMEMKAKEFDQRVEIQNALQREADLTFRFRSLCNRIRPLRDEEQQKKKKSHILQAIGSSLLRLISG
ncbi:hypothetical protein L6452_02141 [Arctium lappa]|uniref:Uncharacterized protein n=1 Tax=Arctium lappa TaxID=4217 RepID=A0ACB9FIT0_ARCLA|nr:hypothetical protein L6452_02141 [Arctium lappa]